ncbi:hypothetical protein [Alkaliphilus sp. B6464]|uniref:hypothetical protein n=1 Tax=Alkaliphilus sp. B6464 TaxID=2731219 RepID=UPI001BA60373|nr:hypothetical protein [Alkaliphilus sp. B6464]QUH22057.1 hypothetical protein HYG84_19315 [Alkaliphilus sp. B6464]
MTNNIDRRFKISFKSLNEKQEMEISSSISDYLIWYNNNKELVNFEIKKEGQQVNMKSIIDFWNKYIGKSRNIEKYLQNISVVADVYEFAEKYNDKILMIKTETEKQVIYKNQYRTHEQADKIRIIFNKYPDNPKVQEIIDYLNRNKYDEDHLTKDYAERIINTCLAHIKNNRF